MNCIWIGQRHSKRDPNVLIPPEVFTLRALLKEGKCSQGKLIREYHIHPEQTTRAVTSLRSRGLIYVGAQKDKLRLTDKGEEIARQLENYLPTENARTRASKHWHPEYTIPMANGQVGTKIINVGGGEAELFRHINGNPYHAQFQFKASMLIPPGEQWRVKPVKGTPFISIEDV
ncbi:MAG: MarR family winged helix-turn-helix transcriptional regulator [Candidatus Bathyarchaeia archaeon]